MSDPKEQNEVTEEDLVVPSAEKPEEDEARETDRAHEMAESMANDDSEDEDLT
ncbi:hypothetical protein AB4Y63_12010 [Leifsonia sp. YAF41]|uniref:hypothetical protein n=1 Tax=Leifsonia sp. YAF41 TaxID=3233086 RepID=UPI003F975C6B